MNELRQYNNLLLIKVKLKCHVSQGTTFVYRFYLAYSIAVAGTLRMKAIY